MDLELEVGKLIDERDIRDKLHRYQEAINSNDLSDFELRPQG